MKPLDSILRSMYQISLREGKDTNWESLRNNILTQLKKLNGYPDNLTEQELLRITATPLTYRKQEKT